jgi:hypothetical protein
MTLYNGKDALVGTEEGSRESWHGGKDAVSGGGSGPASYTFVQSVYDPVKPGIVHWSNIGTAPDTAGASYPGPGPFGGTSNFTVIGSW